MQISNNQLRKIIPLILSFQVLYPNFEHKTRLNTSEFSTEHQYDYISTQCMAFAKVVYLLDQITPDLGRKVGTTITVNHIID